MGIDQYTLSFFPSAFGVALSALLDFPSGFALDDAADFALGELDFVVASPASTAITCPLVCGFD